MVLGDVNRVLAPLGRRLGPDPASTDIATVGGVIANNSGGMRCGSIRDSYSTVTELTFALPSGTVIDTGSPDAAERFARGRARAGRGPRADPRRDPLRRRPARADPPQVRDQEHDGLPALRVPRRRRAGRDLPPPPGRQRGHARLHRRGGLRDGSAAAGDDAGLGPLRVDRRGDRAGRRPGRRRRDGGRADGGAGADGRRQLDSRHARVLEGAAARVGGAAGRVRRRGRRTGSTSARPPPPRCFEAHAPFREVDFTREPETIELFWRVREGLHGLIGRLRPPGTALIVEDVCVPPARIAEAADEIRALLTEHGFLGGVAGHASAGNLHFMLTPDFSKPEDVERYETLHGPARRRRPRHLRRLAEGRARDRRQHGAVRRARVGDGGRPS